MIIYKITNLLNNKIYIGKTKNNVIKRWKQHLYSSINPKTPIHYAIKKYGNSNFKIENLHICNDFNELDEKEKYYIKYYNSIENGYNLTEGGDGNSNPSIEIRKRMSLNHSDINGKNNPMHGKHHSKETRKKISLSNIGKKHSLLSREKMSASQKIRMQNPRNNPMYGKHFSKETIKRMGLMRSGEKNPMYGKHHSLKSKKAISINHKGQKNFWYGKKIPFKMRKKMSLSHKGIKFSSEHKNNLSLAIKKQWKIRHSGVAK